MAKIDYNFVLLLVVLTKIVSMGGGITDDGLSDTTEQLWEEHSPIYINGNEGFQTTAQSEGWPGNGSLTNPYLIEGLNITSKYQDVLWILSTDVHFQVTNCHLALLPVPVPLPCYIIIFQNVANAIISNNTLIRSDWGIVLEDCSNITFVNNEIRHHGEGIRITSSSKNIQIINNNISGIYFDAIELQGSEDSVISGNRINWTIQGIGINIHGGRNNRIHHNNIRNCNSSGIVLDTSEQTHLMENIISNNNGTGIA
ncbi:MAG: right-handed parallel beta-helix repeat-containing protein, partial [Candidatus Hermodarchaeota archaeon]